MSLAVSGKTAVLASALALALAASPLPGSGTAHAANDLYILGGGGGGGAEASNASGGGGGGTISFDSGQVVGGRVLTERVLAAVTAAQVSFPRVLPVRLRLMLQVHRREPHRERPFPEETRKMGMTARLTAEPEVRVVMPA